MCHRPLALELVLQKRRVFPVPETCPVWAIPLQRAQPETLSCNSSSVGSKSNPRSSAVQVAPDREKLSSCVPSFRIAGPSLHYLDSEFALACSSLVC